ncbi:MAG: NADH-quinone oxidoreductase subunit M [Bacteroidetes bacterium]|nr:NADH-quinone oxidoreductase subunit M [Bacteroidota bacterium]
MFPILLLLLPIVSALVLLALPGSISKRVALVGSILSLAMVLYALNTLRFDAASANLVYNQIWLSSLGSNLSFSIDGITMVLLLLTNILMPLIILSTFNREIHKPKAYLTFMLFMQSALVGVFMATDGLVFYIFWELALIPIYFICLFWGGEGRQRITFKFFIYTLLGSLFMLVALIILYQHTTNHSFAISDLYAAGKSMTFEQQAWVFWFFFLAFAIKMPVFPFHTWQPDTYTNAPTQGTMLLSGIMLKMGTYGLIRWLLPMVPEAVSAYSNTVIILSIISVVYASCIAIVQTSFKRLIAYSSIAHVGLICAGIFSYKAEGIQGALVQMFAHGVNVVGLFFVCDIIQRNAGTDTIANLGGIRSVNQRFAFWFLVIMLGSVALPLTNSFVGEFLLLNGIYQYNVWYAAIGGLTIILGAVYMFRSYQAIMLGTTSGNTLMFASLKKSETLVFVFIVFIIMVCGIYPKIILDISALDVLKMIMH